MRIAHVVLSHPTTSLQGDQKLVLYLAEAQRARGQDAAVVTDRNGLFTDTYKQAGIPVLIADDLRPDGAASPTSSFPARIRQFDADIIHYHHIQAAKVTAPAATSLKLPRVITMHTEVEPELRGLVAAKRSGQDFTLVAVCKEQFEIMQRADMAGIDFHYVPNGTKIPPGTGRPERRTSRLPNLISVGALQFRKGIDVAILAMVELRRRHGADCPALNIYGEGAQGRYFMEMADVLRLEDLVKFHGFQRDILDRCSGSDILIQPSRGDLGPLVILEAMGRGMPIVAADMGDISEMLPDKKYGRVVPVESITKLVDAIDATLADIASGQFDPDLVIQRHRSQFSSEKMADRIDDIYQSVLKP